RRTAAPPDREASRAAHQPLGRIPVCAGPAEMSMSWAPENLMPKHLLTIAALLGGSALVGQNTAALPPAFKTLPGNVGVAMPLRWSKGKMQVFIDPPMMPTGFVGETITGLRLRRSVLAGSPAFPA